MLPSLKRRPTLPIPALQLDVKNCKDIYASFDKYTEVGWLHWRLQAPTGGCSLGHALSAGSDV